MSVIPAVSDGKRVVMGGDSGISGPNEIYRTGDPKVARIGELLVGCCGLGRGIYAIHHRMAWPMPGDDLHAWRIACEDALRAALEATGLVYRCEELHTDRAQVQTLVGVRGNIFHFEQTMTGALLPREAAIGSGRLPAYGALFATRGLDLTLEERVRRALTAAAEYCTGVCGPFTILSSDGGDEVDDERCELRTS